MDINIMLVEKLAKKGHDSQTLYAYKYHLKKNYQRDHNELVYTNMMQIRVHTLEKQINLSIHVSEDTYEVFQFNFYVVLCIDGLPKG